jgi:uncharacterized phage protein (TIGR01671 family)
MMQEISFRAWIDDFWSKPSPSQMCKVINLSFGAIIDGKRKYGVKFQELTGSQYDHYIDIDKLMQFTGLLDKNGKKIFEGDIWQWIGGLREEIKWDEDMCCFNIDKSSLGEVIGNIYENPELLK